MNIFTSSSVVRRNNNITASSDDDESIEKFTLMKRTDSLYEEVGRYYDVGLVETRISISTNLPSTSEKKGEADDSILIGSIFKAKIAQWLNFFQRM